MPCPRAFPIKPTDKPGVIFRLNGYPVINASVLGSSQSRHSLTCRYRVRKMKRLEFDFLNTESEYRSYLTAASRLNFAVGREVIP